YRLLGAAVRDHRARAAGSACRRHEGRPQAEVLAARRRLHRLPDARAPGPGDGLRHHRPRRQPHGHRPDHGGRRQAEHRLGGAQPGGVLRPRVLRLVHALPRRPALDRKAAGRAGAQAGPRRRPGGPRAADPLPRPRKDVLRPCAGRHGAAAIGAEVFPRRVRGLHRQAGAGGRLRQTRIQRNHVAIIHVDGKQYEVDGGDNLLHACLSLGLDIPYFCWHPELGSVGACRQCAVNQYRDANDKQGRLVMSCMTPAADGTYIAISDEEAKSFRASVAEWLMTNHPHDCPVCEEGGHCHLQDMTVMTGHASRRYRFTKRTHQNQYLGPFINHEMNRCIACYRCVRYYKDYAGGTDLGVYGTAANVYFGRETDGILESEFSGNLTEVCPTGVFTDKTHGERYNRKWDMQFAPSVCQNCAVGCNTSPGERYGEIRRIENRYNGSVNHYFLCDRGRFGYGFVNRKDRPRQPLVRQDGQLAAAAPDQAVLHAANLLKGAKKIIGIGSPRASVEANYALRKLVGAGNFFDGHAAAEGVLVKKVAKILGEGHVRIPSLRVIEQADAAFVLGEDVTNTAPRIALALRQTARGRQTTLAGQKHIAEWQAAALADIGQHDKNPVFVASVEATRIDDVAAATLRAAPEDLARLGFAVAHEIDSAAPAVTGLDEAAAALARNIAEKLLAASRPLVVSGTGAGLEAVIDAAANITRALQAKGRHVELSLVVPEANSMGLALMDAPGLDQALDSLAAGGADAVVVLENDLYRRAPAGRVDAALKNARLVV